MKPGALIVLSECECFRDLLMNKVEIETEPMLMISH